MIQRIQTLYLFFSAMLMLLLPFVNYAWVGLPSSLLEMDSLGFTDAHGLVYEPTWTQFVLNVIIVILSFLAIFLFKNRVYQMRVTLFGLLLKFGFILLGALHVYTMSSRGALPFGISGFAAIPFIAIVFDYLAFRGIAIDERTVRYMDRLR